MKKFLAVLLALTMLLSLGVMANAEDEHEHEHEHETATEIGDQITFLAARFEDLKQSDDEGTWYYAVTDLDHNGRLELLANRKDEKGRSALKAWEVSPNGTSLVICTRNTIPSPVGSEEKDLVLDSMLLNLHSNSVDTHYDPETDTYYYSFIDSSEGSSFVLDGKLVEAASVLTGVGAISLKSGTIAPSVILGSSLSYIKGPGDLKVICRNGKGEEISMEEFLSLSLNAFSDLPRFNTAFDWFTADEAENLQRFVDSYATFDGVLCPNHPIGSVTTVASVSYGGVYITKNPTDEKLSDGQTAEFIADANIYDDVTWTFIAPDGRTYNEQEFVKMCGGIPDGTKTGNLKIKNVNTDMNGWGVFATFDYRGASARTSTAYLYVWKTGNSGKDLDSFYQTKTYLNPGGWSCPFCSSWAYGSECWSCGFNPVSYYATYYNVTPASSGWYYGVNGQTSVSGLTQNSLSASFTWVCPVCGKSCNNVMYCWNCGHHYGDSYTSQVAANTIVEANMGAELRKCQYCGQWFNSDYDVCPYCGKEPDDGTQPDPWYNTVMELHQGAELRRCTYCGEYFNNDYDTCPYCHMAPDDGTYYTQAEINTWNEFRQGADLIMCRYCGEWFNSDYDTCPHCGNAPDDGYSGDGSFAGYTEGGNARYNRIDEEGNEYSTVICPYCGWEHSMAINCPNCGGGYT